MFCRNICKMFSKAISQCKHFQKCKISLFFQLFQKQNCTFVFFSVKKMYFRNSYWIESKKIFLDLWYFPLCSGLIFCWKKQKPSKIIQKCSQNRVFFLEQFRGNRTISTPLEFSKISFFQKMCFSWFALYLDPTDW